MQSWTHTHTLSLSLFFSLYLAALALVMATGLFTGRTRRAGLVVVVLAALQASIVTAAVRRGEVRVPQVLSQWTLWTGVEEAFPLGLLHAHLGVTHPSSYLRGEDIFISKMAWDKNSLDKKTLV